MPSASETSTSSVVLGSVHLKKQLESIEQDIRIWRSRNSQSDPGAMMELRELRREYERIKTLLNAPSTYK